MRSATDQQYVPDGSFFSVTEQMQNLERVPACETPVDNQRIGPFGVPLDAGKPVYDATGAQVTEPCGDLQPEGMKFPDDEKAVFALLLVERHQYAGLPSGADLTTVVAGQELARFDAIEIQKTALHPESVPWEHRVAVVNFQHAR